MAASAWPTPACSWCRWAPTCRWVPSSSAPAPSAVASSPAGTWPRSRCPPARPARTGSICRRCCWWRWCGGTRGGACRLHADHSATLRSVRRELAAFTRQGPPKAQGRQRHRLERSGKRTGKRPGDGAFLTGERLALKPAHRRGKRRTQCSANLSGKADSGGPEQPESGCSQPWEPVMSADLLKTPLHALHLELGARMVPFAGYDDAGQLPRRHHRRAQAVPRVGGAVRRLAHGPGAPGRRRRRQGTGDAGAGGRARPGRRPAALRPVHRRQRRHPRRPDGHAARGRPAAGGQRRLQGRRHPPPGHPHRPPLPGGAAARARLAGAAGPARRRGAGAPEPGRVEAGVHDRRRLQAGRRRLLRHPLRLHRRGRLRDLGAGGSRGGAGPGADQPARGQARGAGRARHAAPGSRAVPVRPRHRHPHQPGPGRADLGDPEGAPTRRRARRPLPWRRRHRRPAGPWRDAQARRPDGAGARAGARRQQAGRCQGPQAGHRDQRHASRRPSTSRSRWPT